MKNFIVGLTCLGGGSTPGANIRRYQADSSSKATDMYIRDASADERRAWGDTWKLACVEVMSGTPMPDGFELVRSQFGKFPWGWMCKVTGRRSFISADEAAADAWVYSERAAR